MSCLVVLQVGKDRAQDLHCVFEKTGHQPLLVLHYRGNLSRIAHSSGARGTPDNVLPELRVNQMYNSRNDKCWSADG